MRFHLLQLFKLGIAISMSTSSRTTAHSGQTAQPKINIEHGKFNFNQIANSEAKKSKKAHKSGSNRTADKEMGNFSSSQENITTVSQRPDLNEMETQNHDDHHDCPEAKKWQRKYEDLEARFANLEKEMEKIKAIKDVQEVRTYLSKQAKSEAGRAAEIKQLNYKLNLLTNTVIRFEEKLQEANDKIVTMQTRSMRRNIIVSGIQEDTNETREGLRRKIEQFLTPWNFQITSLLKLITDWDILMDLDTGRPY